LTSFNFSLNFNLWFYLKKCNFFNIFLISSFRRVVNLACTLLGCFPACGV
jgi:hypothetical protein